jgi:hypothetical protein
MMHEGSVLKNGRPGGSGAPADLSAAALFNMLWESLAEVLGTAATATLLRRAARRALPRCAQLAELTIERENLEYRYTLPPAWGQAGKVLAPALNELVGELRALLIELTGPVVLHHLEQVPALRDLLISPQKQEQQ